MIANKSSGMQSGQPVTVARIPNTHLSKMQHLAPFNLYSWNVTSLINASSRYTDLDNTAHFYGPWKRSGNNYASMKASCHCLQLQHLPCWIRLLIITYTDIFQIFQEFIRYIVLKCVDFHRDYFLCVHKSIASISRIFRQREWTSSSCNISRCMLPSAYRSQVANKSEIKILESAN